MLSPHEFATLLLVKDAPDQRDMDRDELDILLEQQLVRLEGLGSGRKYCVTETGDAALRSIKYRYSWNTAVPDLTARPIPAERSFPLPPPLPLNRLSRRAASDRPPPAS